MSLTIQRRIYIISPTKKNTFSLHSICFDNKTLDFDYHGDIQVVSTQGDATIG